MKLRERIALLKRKLRNRSIIVRAVEYLLLLLFVVVAVKMFGGKLNLAHAPLVGGSPPAQEK